MSVYTSIHTYTRTDGEFRSGKLNVGKTSIHTYNICKCIHLYTHTHAQTANSDPANLMWEKDKTYLTCVSPGLYEIQVSS